MVLDALGPKEFIVVGGATIFRGTMRLEPVSIDRDGAIVPISRTHYGPASGWRHDPRESLRRLCREMGCRVVYSAKGNV
jgi:hypothetical protein